MDVTFLVAVRLDTLEDLPAVAQEINDDLSQSGFDVISVAPWQRPSLTAVAPIVPTTETQTQPNNEEIV